VTLLASARPIVGSYGARDRTLRGAVDRLERALTANGDSPAARLTAPPHTERHASCPPSERRWKPPNPLPTKEAVLAGCRAHVATGRSWPVPMHRVRRPDAGHHTRGCALARIGGGVRVERQQTRRDGRGTVRGLARRRPLRSHGDLAGARGSYVKCGVAVGVLQWIMWPGLAMIGGRVLRCVGGGSGWSGRRL
jgi:hypothetical protein